MDTSDESENQLWLSYYFFYGSRQGPDGLYGDRIKLYLKETHLFNIKLGKGMGTNTWVELLALWGSLSFAL